MSADDETNRVEPTQEDRETARLAVATVLRMEEAAWEPMTELLAAHTSALRKEIDELRIKATLETTGLRASLAASQERCAALEAENRALRQALTKARNDLCETFGDSPLVIELTATLAPKEGK